MGLFTSNKYPHNSWVYLFNLIGIVDDAYFLNLKNKKAIVIEVRKNESFIVIPNFELDVSDPNFSDLEIFGYCIEGDQGMCSDIVRRIISTISWGNADSSRYLKMMGAGEENWFYNPREFENTDFNSFYNYNVSRNDKIRFPRYQISWK